MRLLRNAAYSLAGGLVPAAVSLATVPLYLHVIGAERYGALAIAWLLLGFFGQADFGIGRALTQRLATMRDADGARLAAIVWSALAALLAIGLITATILLAGAWWYFTGPFQSSPGIRQEMLASLWLLALSSPVVALSGALNGALMGVEKFRLTASADLVSGIGLQLLPLAAAVVFGPQLVYLIAAALLARVLAIALAGAGVWRTFLRGQPIGGSRAEMRPLLRFGAWVMVSALVGPAILYADRFAIGALASAAAVAAYTIPYQIAGRTLMLPLALSQALFPRLAHATGETSHGETRDFAILVAQLSAPGIAALIVLAEPLLRLWLGAALDPRSIEAGRILLAGFWFNGIAFVPFAFIQARGEPRFTAMLHVLELPVYLGLLFWLGAAFGLAGVATAFAIRCALDCAALWLKARIASADALRRCAVPAALVVGATLLGGAAADWRTALPAAIAVTAAAVVAALVVMPPAIKRRAAQLPGAWLVPGWRRREPPGAQ